MHARLVALLARSFITNAWAAYVVPLSSLGAKLTISKPSGSSKDRGVRRALQEHGS